MRILHFAEPSKNIGSIRPVAKQILDRKTLGVSPCIRKTLKTLGVSPCIRANPHQLRCAAVSRRVEGIRHCLLTTRETPREIFCQAFLMTPSETRDLRVLYRKGLYSLTAREYKPFIR